MAKQRRLHKFKQKNIQPDKGFAHREHRSKKGRTQGARNPLAKVYKKNKEKLKYEDYRY